MDLFTPLLEWLKANRKPETVAVSHDGVSTSAIVLPAGMTAESVTKFTDKLLTKPRRKTGAITVDTLDSFCDVAKTHKEDGSSVIFCKAASGAMTAVLNFHEAKADGQRFGDLRVAYSPAESAEWKAWTAKSGESMTVPEFAEFIDEHIVDITEPPAKNSDADGDKALLALAKLYSTTYAEQTEIITLSRGLRVHVNDQVESVVNTGTGECHIEFKSEHQGRDGQRLEVPGLFCIAIPVFERGVLYRLPCRLKYRAVNGGVRFSYELLNEDKAKEHAINQMVDKAKTETQLPLYFGTAPEVPRAA